MPPRFLPHLVAAACFSLAAAHAPAQDKAVAVEAVHPADHLGQHQYALVIGVDDYADPGVPDLTLCERDARAVHALLTDPAHGGVNPQHATLLTGPQASFRSIRKAFNDLRRIPNDATVFIYFSGHGAKEGDEAFWVTQDAELADLAATGLPDRDVRAFIQRIPAQRVVVMIDACYAAATVKGGKATVTDFSGVLNKFTGQGVAYLMAAGSGEEAIEAADLKHSVFTHYLLEGLRGRADTAAAGGNADGVVVLPELTTYIDRHVAEEARLRGGVQKPTTIQDVQEPAKFRLTIDAQRIAANLRDTAAGRALRQRRLAKLEALYLDDQLTRDQAQQGLRLVRADASTLDPFDAKRLGYYLKVADGELPTDRLQRALDLVETPAQRTARLARETRAQAQRERPAQIEKLWATAQAHDSKAQGQTALKALQELLALAPNHRDAQRLRDKIAGYYGPQEVGETWTNSIGMTLAYIPAGTFTMGSPADEYKRAENERQHRVTLTRPFLMGVTEVTRSQFAMFIADTKYQTEAEKDEKGGGGIKGTSFEQSTQYHWRHTGFDYQDDHPVVNVSWNDANAFCRWLSRQDGRTYTLPTEAQWEYACRAGTQNMWGGQVGTGFNFANVPDQSAKQWFSDWIVGDLDDGRVFTAPVGTYTANRWGLHDTIGNVLEWCNNWHSDYPSGAVRDPQGPNSGEYRVIRGGAWGIYTQNCRAAFRDYASPETRNPLTGLRVVSPILLPALKN